VSASHGLCTLRSRHRMRASGFTLLEILIAIAIFAFVAGAAMQSMANSDYLASSARRARELRMLASRKLGEILTFEQAMDDNVDPKDFDYEEYGDHFKGWQWQLDVRDVTVFGIATAENAEYLFGPPTEEEKAAAGTTSGTQQAQPGSGGGAKKGDAQPLRELTLKVSAPADDGPADSVQIIMFAPIVNRKTAAGTKPQ
jgi:prepilin-type N-terminal cleavage/methylation domain-containing protein